MLGIVTLVTSGMIHSLEEEGEVRIGVQEIGSTAEIEEFRLGDVTGQDHLYLGTSEIHGTQETFRQGMTSGETHERDLFRLHHLSRTRSLSAAVEDIEEEAEETTTSIREAEVSTQRSMRTLGPETTRETGNGRGKCGMTEIVTVT